MAFCKLHWRHLPAAPTCSKCWRCLCLQRCQGCGRRSWQSFFLLRLDLAVLWHTLFDLFGPRTCPNRSEIAAGLMGTDFQSKPSILDPISVFFKFPEVLWTALRGKYTFGKRTPKTNRCMFLYCIEFYNILLCIYTKWKLVFARGCSIPRFLLKF